MRQPSRVSNNADRPAGLLSETFTRATSLQVGARTERRDERSLEVNTENPHPSRADPGSLSRNRDRCEQVLSGCCNQRRLKGGEASSALPGLPVAIDVCRQEVHAAEAVDLQVDYPGTARPEPPRASPTAAIARSTTSTSPRTRSPATIAARTPSLMDARQRRRSTANQRKALRRGTWLVFEYNVGQSSWMICRFGTGGWPCRQRTRGTASHDRYQVALDAWR